VVPTLATRHTNRSALVKPCRPCVHVTAALDERVKSAVVWGGPETFV
jgi:hypothetical protein